MRRYKTHNSEETYLAREEIVTKFPVKTLSQGHTKDVNCGHIGLLCVIEEGIAVQKIVWSNYV